MTINVDLGRRLEILVDDLVQAGTYPSRDALVRDAVRLIEDRETRFAELDVALEEGLADIKAGRTYALDEVRAHLDRKFGGMDPGSKP